MHTEGWPAALHVAALSIRGRNDRRAAVAAFAGDDRLMADYLRDEILAPLPLPTAAFLLRTSVLERLSGPACDRLTGTAGSGTLLRELSRAGIPLVPLDRTDDEYRHHPLLAEMLRAEQRRRDPLRTADLHRRAAAWHEREGQLDEAVGHALAAGDDGDVAARLWAIAPSRIAHGGVRGVRAWLARLRPEQVAAHAPLALTAAATHLVDGDRDRLEHWLGRAERLIAGGEEIEGSPAAARAVLRAALARRGTSAMVDDAATAYELTSEDDPWHPLACLLRGAGLYLLGDGDRAVGLLEEGARRGGLVAPSAQVLCLAQLALIRADDEDWETAALLASRARAQLERADVADYPSSALVFAVSALVRAHRDRVEAAQDDRRQAVELLGRLVDPPAWYAVETRIALARTTLRLGDAAGSRALAGEAARALRELPDAPLAARQVEAVPAPVRRVAARRPRDVHHRRAARAAPAPDPPLLPGDGRRPARDREHGQDPRALGLPQARRVVALGGRRTCARHRPARRSRPSGVTVPRRAILRGRIRRERPEAGDQHSEPTYFVDLEPGELSGVFAAPSWLRDFGVLAWLLVGISRADGRGGDAAGADEHDRHPRRHGDDRRRRVRPARPAPREAHAARGGDRGGVPLAARRRASASSCSCSPGSSARRARCSPRSSRPSPSCRTR